MGGKSIYPFLWVLLITILLFLWMFGKKKSRNNANKKQQSKQDAQKSYRHAKQPRRVSK